MSGSSVFLFVFFGAAIVAVSVIVIRRVVSPGRIAALEGYLDSGNTKSAIRNAKSILSKNEKNTDAHWYLGEAYRLENRLDLAAVEYKYIVNSAKYTITCTERKAREALAHTYLKLRQLDEAQKEFLLLMKLEPNNFEYCYKSASLFEERNFTESALKNYKKVISLNPKHAPSYTRIGVILFQKKMLNEAKRVLLAALRLDPQSFAPHYYLGKLAMTTGDIGTALTHFEKAQQDPDLRQRALFEKAQINIAKGDANEAIAELEKALESGEEDLSVALHLRYLLAQCYESAKDIGRAIEQWENIYEKNPRYKDVAEKLSLYSDLRADDRLKDFLIAPQAKFQEYCAKLVEAMGLAVQDVFLRSQDLVEVFALETQSKWRNAKKLPSIVRVYRSVDPVGYDVIRGLYDQMRKMNALRSICISASKFTRTAIEFAQIRPIELIDKEELTRLLSGISI